MKKMKNEKTLLGNLRLAWLTTSRVQSFFVSSASADIARLGALLLGLEAGCHPLQTKLLVPVNFGPGKHGKFFNCHESLNASMWRTVQRRVKPKAVKLYHNKGPCESASCASFTKHKDLLEIFIFVFVSHDDIHSSGKP